MPLYEYQCKKCKHRFEKIQTYSDKPIKKCPECGGPVEKLLSAPAIQFKGSGWYVNDYAKKSGATSDGESSAKSSDGTKSDDKSAAKSDGEGAKAEKPEKSEAKESKDPKPKAESSSSGKKKK